MAGFDVPVAAMQPNQYLTSFSQGTDRASLQPLADVPKLSEKVVEPKYKTDTTAGEGITDVGKLETLGVNLTDGIIKQNIDSTLNDGISKIRDSFGVAQADDIESGVAAAVGRGGADGVSLVDSTGKTPAVLQKLGTQVDGLTEAYQQGQLSNSAYYAKMDAYVRQVKQQFPGYADDVDQMTSSKLGVTPANALRGALQDDVAKLASKVNAQNDKWTTYENTNTQYIHTQWPNYEVLKQNGQAPSRAEVQSIVGNMQARDYGYTSKQAALSAGKAEDSAISDKAEQIVASKASDLSAHLTVGVTNSLGIKNASDFQQLLNDVRNGKRKPLTPDELQQASGVFATMKQQYGINFDKFVNNNVDQNGLPIRPMTTYLTPAKISALRDQGMQAIKDMEDGLTNDKYGILSSSAIYNKATLDAAEGDFVRRAPVAAAVAAGRKFYGDQGLTTLTLNQPILQSNMLEGFRQWNQGSLAQGTGSLRDTLDTYKREGVNDGTLNKASIADTANTILHAEKMDDKDAGAKAVQHAFGPGNRTLLDAFNDKDQIGVFGQLVSKPMVDKISKMDGKSKQTFTSWADDGFTSVYEAQAAQANQAAAGYSGSANLNMKYDPKTNNFSYEGTSNPLYPGSNMNGRVNAANQQLQGLNTAINSMKEVWKMEGKDPTEALYTLLPAIGAEPGTPIYKALQTEFDKTQPKDKPT